MNQTQFTVTKFVNRNGVTSWRVAGMLHGLRIRKNFPTREEAAAEKAVLEVRAAQTSDGMRTGATSLTLEQVREAGNSEAIIQRHYLNLEIATEAEAFFRILPKRCAMLAGKPLTIEQTSIAA